MNKLEFEFDSALDLWLQAKSNDSLVDNFKRLWRCGPCAVLRYARERKLTLRDTQLLQLQTLADATDRDDRALFLVEHLQLAAPNDATETLTLARQLLDLTQGISHATLAAAALHTANWTENRQQPLPADFVRHARRAMVSFRAAWPFTAKANEAEIAAISTPHTSSVRLASNEKTPLSYQALDALRAQPREKSADAAAGEIDVASWLAVRRLLGYLLDGEEIVPAHTDQPAAAPPSVAATFVTIDETGRGRSGDARFWKSGEGQLGFYVDPVGTGLLLLDRQMLDSLKLGWRCCRSTLRAMIDPKNSRPPLTLRLAPRIHDESESHRAGQEPRYDDTKCLLLAGGSAGGLTAVAMHAAANDLPFDDEATATIAIQLAEGVLDDDSDLTADQIVTAPVDDKSIPAKAYAAVRRGKQRMIVHENQAGADKSELPKNLTIETVNRLSALVSRLTVSSRMEAVLKELADANAADWFGTEAQSGKRPTRFIEPHYAWVLDEDARMKRGKQSASKADGRLEFLDPLLDKETRQGITLRTGHQEEIGDAELKMLVTKAIEERQAKSPIAEDVSPGMRLILAEDSNAGKTVFTYRLKLFLATAGPQIFGGPVLVRRWENRSGSFPWPTGDDLDEADRNLRLDLERAIEPHCPANGPSPKEVVQYAIKRGRVVLILDAADQATAPKPLLDALSTLTTWHRCHVVVTGRSFWFSTPEGADIFPNPNWTRSQLLGFDENQQARYLDDVVPASAKRQRKDPDVIDEQFRELFYSYPDIAELLTVPGMIEMARELILIEQASGRKQTARLEKLKTRCDFYWEYYNQPLMNKSVAQRTQQLKVGSGDHERWQMMLAVTAFCMVLHRLVSFSARGEKLRSIQADVERYCEQLEPSLWTKTKPAEQWSKLARFSPFANHKVLEDTPDINSLSWRHKGWMEFFLALFFAKYADAAAIRALSLAKIGWRLTDAERQLPGYAPIDEKFLSSHTDEQVLHAVLTQITNDRQWYWGWRMATEIPRVPVAADDDPPLDSDRLCRSLGALYLPPARGVRPTELMYYAFYLFEQDRLTPNDLRPFAKTLTGTAAVLKAFRQPLQDKVNAGDPIATGMLGSFNPCPPNATPGELAEFWMGEGKERHRVRLTPFRMQQTSVTRSQYRLFDPNFELSEEKSSWGSIIKDIVAKYCGDGAITDPRTGRKRTIHGDDCPIVMTNWYDAFMFAKYLGTGFRLPTEAEREYATRAGKDGPDDAYHTGRELTPQDANFDESTIGRTTPLGIYPLNVFALDQMHGNVWNWCADWYGAYELGTPERPPEDPQGASTGSDRVLRGGSWYLFSRSGRSAYRFRGSPVNRFDCNGFRVVFALR